MRDLPSCVVSASKPYRRLMREMRLLVGSHGCLQQLPPALHLHASTNTSLQGTLTPLHPTSLRLMAAQGGGKSAQLHRRGHA